MKTFSKIVAGMIILVAMYFVVSDGLVGHFDLPRSYQYIYNYAALFLLLPFLLFGVIGEEIPQHEK
jgi:hypothetical protein